MYDGEKFYLELPLDLPEKEERPAVMKLWAQARIRDLERAALTGRRGDAMKDRIVKLAKEYGVSSKYTSFVVVEKRTGDRRVNEQAETRVVPVNAPADWALFQNQRNMNAQSRSRSYGGGVGLRAPSAPPGMAMPAGRGAPRPAAGMPAPRSVAAAPADDVRTLRRDTGPASSSPPMIGAAQRSSSITGGAPPMPPRDSFAEQDDDMTAPPPRASASASSYFAKAKSALGMAPPPPVAPPRREAPSDPITATLERQSASGLWEEVGRDPIEVTVDALLVLVRLGVTTSHPVHGAQTKKAVDALLEALAASTKVDPKLAELALATLWLLSTGRRTRVAIKDATSQHAGLEGLAAVLGRDEDVRAHVERIAPMC